MDVINSIDEKTKCKQRFKGVENFLRRVAFNLGNTPSQTEVKIISCIPIDVTDLQQKIIQLEKQLEDAKTKEIAKDTSKDTTKTVSKDIGKNASKKASKDLAKDASKAKGKENANNPKATEGTSDVPKGSAAIHTTLFSSHFPRFTCANTCKAIECTQSNQGIQCDDSLSNKRKKSAVSFIFPNASSSKVVNCSDKSNYTSDERSHTVLNELRKKFLKKKKKGCKNQKVETQLVYYARTDNISYNRNVLGKNAAAEIPYKVRQQIDRPYLANMVKKQYKSVPVVDELSDYSQFSSPICRDVDQTWRSPRPYESDICSCCHETFHNIDNYMTNTQINNFADLTNNTNNRNAYYDSSLYDLVPVKEKPVRSKKEWKDIDIPKRKDKIDMKCWPENIRTKARCPSVIINYHSVIPARQNHARRYVVKPNKRDSVARIVIKEDKHVLKVNQQTAMESSKSCCVDLGDLYPKPVQKKKTVIMTESIRPPLRNAECFTDFIPKVDCQTATPKVDEKTEMTLNQIKSILQSVLTEVKTNTLSKNEESKVKKDAVIQKGASQSNLLDGSSFLNSFTYSPYNMNPYGPSCSKQMPSNYFCHPVPQSLRCMQNYPLIIQTPGRHMCTSCYRSSQYKSHPKNTTTATNTEEQEKRGKETEKLIQEIYKSVALGLPGKDTSLSEYDDLKSTKTASNKSKETNEMDTKLIISEIFRNNDIQLHTSDTHDTNTTVFYRNHKDMSTRSHSITTEPSTDQRNKFKKSEGNTQQSTETEPEVEKRKYPRRVVKPAKRIETISESTDTETSSNESDTDVTTVAVKKAEKKKSGLISKVFNLFNRNKKKKDAKVESIVDSESSDSDYQTIYSQKITPPKRIELRNQRSRPHSKLHSRRSHQMSRSPERPKRTPYMEQEYRRLWNEKLMFQNARPRYSSEQPARETIPRTRQRPVFYQNYEARSVLVDPRSYQPRYDIINGKPCLAEVNTQRRPYGQYNYQNIGGVRNGRPPLPTLNATRRNVAIQDTAAMRRVGNANKTVTKGLSWLKNHKMKRCGEQWKKFIIES